jgi:cell division control protein 24
MFDVSAGIEALQNALRDINTAMKCQELREAQADLVARVRDWKGYNVKEFGDLLQFDFVSVVTGQYGTAETVCAKPSKQPEVTTC